MLSTLSITPQRSVCQTILAWRSRFNTTVYSGEVHTQVCVPSLLTGLDAKQGGHTNRWQSLASLTQHQHTGCVDCQREGCIHCREVMVLLCSQMLLMWVSHLLAYGLEDNWVWPPRVSVSISSTYKLLFSITLMLQFKSNSCSTVIWLPVKWRVQLLIFLLAQPYG